ncbi:HpcH/HpaI aldolase/citrate lyase family protein [Virgibacillus sp. DJP39]|uniref:HpcH/HpaI aldolase/citrate lyase family protein n=1 Tax=Virgibacillus sp. DJP39 TaxID=3409790 RepID=UPI003BB73992
MDTRHTYLFVPGNQHDLIGKAIRSEADAVIIDLEDSVALSEKKNARDCLENYLEQNKMASKSIYIRVNEIKSKYWEKDVELVAKYPSLGVMLPKTESAEDIHILNKRLSTEQKVIPLIETAKGVMFSYEIANSSQNIIRLAFGAVDYSLELGISITKNEHELIYPRSSLVLASRVAGIESPIDTVFVNIDDSEGLMEETKISIQLGFFAKLCIHPKQVSLINKLFLPTENEIQWAEQIVAAFEEAERQGKAAIKLNGKMIDYPVYKQALSTMVKIK